MFEELCSIYSDALDNVGRYVDQETGECIQQMTIRDFCLTDRWKPQVERLRQLRAEYGSNAKKMPEYIDTKKQLPGATLSGLFELRNDECTRKDGSKFIAPVSRRETHLLQHTGWLAIDIDLADNQHLSNFENVRMVCQFRPEIALLMRSCSGTGYFGLVRLAYPDQHKEQFKALMDDYSAIGITLDKACSNIGRVRFASWDSPDHIYINEQARAYQGIKKPVQALPMGGMMNGNNYQHTPYHGESGAFWLDPIHINRLVELVCQYLIYNRIDITSGYDNWMKLALALQSHPYGERFFHELSQCNPEYNAGITAQKWRNVGTSKTVTYAYLLHQARQYIGEYTYHDLKRQVWQEYRYIE